MIEQLKSVLKPAREIAGELARLVNMEADAKKVIKAAAEAGDIDSPQVQRKVGDAHIRLSLARARHGHVEAESARLEDAVREAYRKEASRWNGLVAEAKEALTEARIAANLPFWDGDERTCRRYYAGHLMEEAPAFYKFNQAFCSQTPPHGDPIRAAEMLATHIARHAKALGWSEEQIARTRAEITSRRKERTEPRDVKVKVRMLETAVLPAVGKTDAKGRPVAIKEGEILEIDSAQYAALSRFFERVAA